MKPRLAAFLLGSASLVAVTALAVNSQTSGAKESQTPSAPAPAAPAETNYPLKTCIVSDEPLNGSDFVTYTHKEPGKPDIVVRLCCEGCIEDFRQNPPKFLKKLDAAQKQKR